MFLGPLFFVALLIGVLGVICWRRPENRSDFPVAATVIAVCIALGAMVLTSAEHVTALNVAKAAGPFDSEHVLREGYSEGVPRLVTAGIILLASQAFCLICVRSNWTRALSTLGVCVLFVPLLWFGTRGVGLHDRALRAQFAVAQETTDDGCMSLAGAMDNAGSLDEAERIEPRAKNLAHECVAMWLTALDEDGQAKRELEIHAIAFKSLHPGRELSSDPLDFILRTPLALDADQRLEIARRKSLAAANAQGRVQETSRSSKFIEPATD